MDSIVKWKNKVVVVSTNQSRNWCLKTGKPFWAILISKFAIRLNPVTCISCHGSFVLSTVHIKNTRCSTNLSDKALKLDFRATFLSWAEWFIRPVLSRGLGKLFMHDGFAVTLIMTDEKTNKKKNHNDFINETKHVEKDFHESAATPISNNAPETHFHPLK